MNVLEKILEEIEHEIMTNKEVGRKQCEGMARAMNIIRSRMDDSKDTNVLSERLIDEQPTVCTGDGWIPYTEQSKPKKDGIYLVTCDDEEYPVKRMRFKECLWYWTYGIYDGKILAWQPLPESYKGGKENE